jgi:glycosyltransferase involved in cell wall biosynthesis
MRGGEKCLEAMCELFPDATLFTLIHRAGHLSPAIERMRIRTSWIQRLPGWRRAYRHLLPLFPAAVESLDLRGHDLVLSSSHCVAKGAVAPPGVPHLCYCYTPMRYAWDQYGHYFGPERLAWWNRRLVPALIGRMRRWDVATAGRPTRYAGISRHVAGRIRQYYGREADVIYPPVDLAAFAPGGAGGGEAYLMVNAFAPYKRIDVAIEAFNRLGRELRIVGNGQDEARLRALAGPNVRFLGWIGPEALRAEYAACRALVFTAEEDFGITPVEALAAGRPVIAFGRGGALETVRPHPGHAAGAAPAAEGEPPTGVFFAEQAPEALAAAVRFFEAHAGDFDPAACRRSVERFDRPRFVRELREWVARHAPGGAAGTARERGPRGPVV